MLDDLVVATATPGECFALFARCLRLMSTGVDLQVLWEGERPYLEMRRTDGGMVEPEAAGKVKGTAGAAVTLASVLLSAGTQTRYVRDLT